MIFPSELKFEERELALMNYRNIYLARVETAAHIAVIGYGLVVPKRSAPVCH